MSKFKIGDKVVVVNADSIYDNYFNGDIGTVVAYDLNPETAGYVQRKDGFVMNVYWTEIKHLEENKEMTAEQIRDEILRIDARIEEAKKDIENAQNERNSLVEKLREKGFQILGENVKYSPGQRVLIVGKQSPRHSESHVGKKGTVEKVDDSDVPYKVILDGSDETSNTWFNSDQVQKI